MPHQECAGISEVVSAESRVFPLVRVCCEYLNAQLSTVGNIFGSLAATQHGNLPLLQIAAIAGSYGVSFLIAWFAAAANTVWERSATRAQSRTVAVLSSPS